MVLKVVMIKTPESSNINAIGYLKPGNLLFVRFNNGRTYSYHGVPATRFADFRDAKSKGEFFGRQVKPFFAAAVVDKAYASEVIFIEKGNGEESVPGPALKPAVDSRWNW